MSSLKEQLAKEIGILYEEIEKTDKEYAKKLAELGKSVNFDTESKKFKAELKKLSDYFAPIMNDQQEKLKEIEQKLQKIEESSWKDN